MNGVHVKDNVQLSKCMEKKRVCAAKRKKSWQLALEKKTL